MKLQTICVYLVLCASFFSLNIAKTTGPSSHKSPATQTSEYPTKPSSAGPTDKNTQSTTLSNKTNGSVTLDTGNSTKNKNTEWTTTPLVTKTSHSSSVKPGSTPQIITNSNSTHNEHGKGSVDLTSGIAGLMNSSAFAGLHKGFGGLSAKQIAELLKGNSALQYHKDNSAATDLAALQGIVKLLGNDTDISISDLQMLQKLMKNKDIMAMLPKLLRIINSDTFTSLIPKLEPLLDSLGNVTNLIEKALPLLGGLLEKSVRGISSTYNITNKCIGSLGDYIQGVIDGKESALEMLDASGKPTTSILKGNIAWIGNYDECQTYGSYCIVNIEPPEMVKKRTNFKVPTGKIDLRIDLCAPHQCSEKELQRLMQHVLHVVNLQLLDVECLEPRGSMKDDNNAIIALCVLGVIGVLTGCGIFLDLMKSPSSKDEESYQISPIDAYDNVTYNLGESDKAKKAYPGIPMNEIIREGRDNSGFDGGESIKRNGVAAVDDGIDDMPESLDLDTTNEHSANENDDNIGFFGRLILSFSFMRNLRMILDTDPRDETLSCIDGIRVLSMCYLMLAFIFTTYIPEQLANGLDLIESKKTFLMQAIINGTLSTDTFFLLSGTVVSYMFIKEAQKRGGIRVTQMIYYYLHRIWRLTPLYGLILMVYYCLSHYLVNGPFENNNAEDRLNCKETWWVNMLYINNVYKTDKMCMVWSTFLADVMQFHIIAPLVLIPFVYLKWVGILFAVPLVLAHIITTAVQEHRLTGSIVDPGFVGGSTDTWFYQIYIKPWTRVAPYAIGLILGYLLVKHKKKTMNITAVIAGWAFALGIILLTSFVTYDNYKSGTGSWNLLDLTIFQAFFRPGWALGVSWIIYACATGHGDAINSFLSWRGWKPLAKLTFAAYLIHPLVQNHQMYNEKVKIFYSKITVFSDLFSLVTKTYLISLFVCVLLEAPFRAMEKAILRKKKMQSKNFS